jgi:hypothetical protein
MDMCLKKPEATFALYKSIPYKILLKLKGSFEVSKGWYLSRPQIHRNGA